MVRYERGIPMGMTHEVQKVKKETYYGNIEHLKPMPLPTIMLGAGRGLECQNVQKYVKGESSSSSCSYVKKS